MGCQRRGRIHLAVETIREMKSSKTIVRLYYAFQFFFSLLVWIPIFYRYQREIGLNDQQIFSIQSIYYIFFCILEIPTGLIADFWGHRRCMIAGALTLVISNLLPIFFQSYHGFLFHFLSIALARSFISGASSAYLYNYLSTQKQAEDFKQIEGSARAYGLIGKVVCWSAVGWLMAWHLTLPYWLTVLTSGLSLFFAILLPPLSESKLSNKKDEQKFIGKTLLSQLSEAFRNLLTSPFLFLIMLQGIAIFVLSRIAQVNLYQPILESKQYGIESFGPVMSAMTVFEALGSAKPGWIRKWMSDLNAVFFLTAIMAVSIASMIFGGKALVFILFCVFSYATGLSFPIQRQLLNDAITDSRFRATLLSIESIIDRAVCAWTASLMGAFLATGRLNQFLVLSGEVTLGFLVLVALGLQFTSVQKKQKN